MDDKTPSDQLELELDICSARISQLQNELEHAYRKVSLLREEISQRHFLYSNDESVDLLQRFLAWRESAYIPSRSDGISQFLRSETISAKEIARTVGEFNRSSWFDSGWYVDSYPQVGELRITPAEHYLRYGAVEGKDPSRNFSTLGYLVRYPDVVLSGLNPLTHFLRYGLAEGRSAGIA
ncbi:MAG: hypothetical protein AAGI88_19850 [Pseudomonadota bacterium]